MGAVAKKQQEQGKSKNIVAIMAAKQNLSELQVWNTLKNTCFKVKDREATNEELLALMVVANRYGLDPFLNQIYAFPSKKGGIIPVVGIDGFIALALAHPDYDGFELTYSEDIVEVDKDAKPCPEWIEAKVFKRGQTYPVTVREYVDECYQSKQSKGGYNSPWQTHTKRMLRHKTLIQAFRVAFGFTGLFDEDEALRIKNQEAVEAEMVDLKEPQPLNKNGAEKDKAAPGNSEAAASPTDTGAAPPPSDTQPGAAPHFIYEDVALLDNEPPFISANDIKWLYGKIKNTGKTIEMLKEKFAVEHLNKCPLSKWDAIKSWLDEREPGQEG